MKKILVGLSGGVDSAVAAYLLKQQGHDVTCCFMRNWDAYANQDIEGNPTIMDDVCPQEKDYQDACDVAKQLGLPMLRVDFVKEYWDQVFVEFLEEYKVGRTPNPDILCNKYIKFESFFDYAKSKGFDYVATGHYAKVSEEDGHYFMEKADDRNKDQSYFLSQVDPAVLDSILFPLGNIDKEEVREIAEAQNFIVADKKDSTGICFIGERNFQEFLSNYLPAQDGDIIDVKSKQVLGRHTGVLYYTLGQRKGLGIGGNKGPWFVVGKDVEKNELYVSNENDGYWLESDAALVSELNWFLAFEEGKEYQAKFRYRQKDNPVKLYRQGEKILVKFKHKIRAITPGQQAVFYDGDKMLGGGVIDQAYHDGHSIDDRIKEALYE